MTELDKLEKMLKERGIKYERLDEEKQYHRFKNVATGEDVQYLTQLDRHQIFVPSIEDCEWDVICQEYSYGYEEGLLEAYGSIVPDGDVEGWLTAEDVIARL